MDIQFGHVDIAVMITEKVFNFQAREGAFLSKYDLLVLDEVGLIDNAERGIYFDFLFVWGINAHRETKKLRMIALGTPFTIGIFILSIIICILYLRLLRDQFH